MSITPKNWASFQHYKDRAPSWIKLHHGLLDDFTFSRLPIASRALAPLLWLLASEYEGGKITASNEEVAFRLRMSESELNNALSPLIDSGFFLASEPLAECKQSACLEREIEEEKEIEKIAPAVAAPPKPVAEKKSRKGNATALPDSYSLPEEVRTYGASLGLSDQEITRDHEKFRNHAKQNDRRCVNWIAAERNWLMGSAERLGREPPRTPSPGATDGPQMFEAKFGSEELDAWDAYGRTKTGKSFPRNKVGGWLFPTQWPPGYVPIKSRGASPQIAPQLQTMN